MEKVTPTVKVKQLEEELKLKDRTLDTMRKERDGILKTLDELKKTTENGKFLRRIEILEKEKNLLLKRLARFEEDMTEEIELAIMKKGAE